MTSCRLPAEAGTAQVCSATSSNVKRCGASETSPSQLRRGGFLFVAWASGHVRIGIRNTNRKRKRGGIGLRFRMPFSRASRHPGFFESCMRMQAAVPPRLRFELVLRIPGWLCPSGLPDSVLKLRIGQNSGSRSGPTVVAGNAFSTTSSTPRRRTASSFSGSVSVVNMMMGTLAVAGFCFK